MIYVDVDCDPDLSVVVEYGRDDRRWIVRGGMAYVAAWLVGLAVKPVGVTSAESADLVVGNYVDHRVASVAQILLVHVAAAAALLVFVFGLSRIAASSWHVRQARVSRWTVSVVVAASLVQAGTRRGDDRDRPAPWSRRRLVRCRLTWNDSMP